MDEKSLRATVEELAACGTRHSLSSWDDPRRGIGCGRDRIAARLQAIAQETGGRLRIVVDRFEATGPRTNDKPARLENVLAFLDGTDPALKKTVFLVSGHFDSMPSSVMDAQTTDPRWEVYESVPQAGEAVLSAVSTDNRFFAVRSVGRNGARSIPVAASLKPRARSGR